MDYIEITWEVDDGYAGRGRPQKTRFYPPDDWDELTEEEQRQQMYDAVQEDFENKIRFCIQRHEKR